MDKSSLEVRIEAPLLADCREIAQVHMRSWQHAYRGLFPDAYLASLSDNVESRQKFWETALAEGTPAMRVARSGIGIAGFVTYGASRDKEADSRCAELWSLYLEPSALARGVGRALWLSARAAMIEEGFETVTLWVLEENALALRFYRTAGFETEPASRTSFERGGAELMEIRCRALLAATPGEIARP